MVDRKEFKMPSGATISFQHPPFEDADELYRTFLEEMKGVKLMEDNIGDMVKNVFCMSLSSKKIKAQLKICMAKTLYNGERINEHTWEPIKAREDYIPACLECMKETL